MLFSRVGSCFFPDIHIHICIYKYIKYVSEINRLEKKTNLSYLSYDFIVSVNIF